MPSKIKNILLVVGILFAGLLCIGGTYAYLKVIAEVTNGNYSGGTGKLNSDLSKMYIENVPISGPLFPTYDYNGGLNSIVCLTSTTSCDDGYMNQGLYWSPATSFNYYWSVVLNVDENNNNIFFKKADPHCENTDNLQTININGDTLDEKRINCLSKSNTIWVENGTALKYAIHYAPLSGGDPRVYKKGYINKVGDITVNLDVVPAGSFVVTVWLDGELADNSYANLPFSGKLKVLLNQVE